MIYKAMSYLLYVARIYTKRYKREVTKGFTKAALFTRSGIQAKLASLYF
jgi:hypothetical protein